MTHTVVLLLFLTVFQMTFAGPEKNKILNMEKKSTVCRHEPIELALVVDSSSSINPDDFKKGQQFLTDFLSEYDIGQGDNQIRVAAVTYGFGVYENDTFNFDTFKTKEEVLQAVRNMPFRSGLRTDTGDAIKYMREKQMVNARDFVKKIAIVLTDGNSQKRTYTAEQAQLARNQNITMFVVGVGKSVSNSELRNIAGDLGRVFRSNSYEDLTHIKEDLSSKTCMIMKPLVEEHVTSTTALPQTQEVTKSRVEEYFTSTTVLPQMHEVCSFRYPSDINFIFSPASLGLDTTSWVTQFISHTIRLEEPSGGFQYGVVSGSCPHDAGFSLNMYSTADQIRARLDRYDRNNLPELVRQAIMTSFSTEKCGRSAASKVAVIFLGKAKVDQSAMYQAVRNMIDAGIQVFVSLTEPSISVSLPEGVRILSGTAISQSQELIERLCHQPITRAD